MLVDIYIYTALAQDLRDFSELPMTNARLAKLAATLMEVLSFLSRHMKCITKMRHRK